MKKRRPKDKSNGRPKASDAGGGLGSPNARSLISALSLLVIVILARVGLEQLTGYVYSLPECRSDIRIELINPPDWVDGEEWRPRILSVLELPSAGELTDGVLVIIPTMGIQQRSNVVQKQLILILILMMS